MGASFAHVAASGPLLLALAVSLVAGLVSFLSPCVLPLVPGYVSYVTGLAGADLDAALGTDPRGRAVTATTARSRARVRGRILAGGLLFVAGFTVVFVLSGVLVASLGSALLEHRVAVERVIGALVIVLGLAFVGVIPGMQREARMHRVPAAGLLGAPVLGAVFALGWTPCVGPTLGAVLSLAAVQGSVGRGVLLAVAYCLGLGIPFLVFGLGFRRLLQVFGVIRRHSVWVTRIGGVLLILVGVALATGAWDAFTIWLQAEVGAGKVSV